MPARPLPRAFLRLATSALVAGSTAGVAETVSFNRDIRPILSDTCFQCHGPDEKERKSGLRLDERASAVKPAESGEIAIVPGQPEKSELLKRLASKDRDEVMPPPKLHKTIKPEQIELFRKWIAEGAEYQGHWAFLPPARAALPKVSGQTVANMHPIDAFIRGRLEKVGLQPSPEAEKATLIRRVALDLTGIPPTAREVDAFLADQAPNAYEKLVDRLLASPRYGERMAVQWLDSARYADSNGFQTDTSRQMWPWRDWVIAAFNRNQPFDQFTVEQLAGDLLPNPTRDQIVATGFHRNGRLNGEGGRIVEEWFAENVIDRVETTGLTWLGLTFNCCRCHDHKYDPITQKEFYQFFAFFNSVDEAGVLDAGGGTGANRTGGNSRPVQMLPTPAQEAQLAKLEAAVTTAQQRVAAAQKEMPKLEKEWEVRFRAEIDQQLKAWQPLSPTNVVSEGGATLDRQEDGSWLAGGKNPPNDSYVITAPLAEGAFSGVLIEALPDPSLPNQSLGRNGNGNFVLTGVEAEITAPTLTEQLVATFTKAEADYEQKGYEVKSIVEENARGKKRERGRKGWAIDGNDPKKRLPRKAMFVTGAPLTVPPDATLIVRLKHQGIANHNIGRFRVSTTAQPPGVVKLDGGQMPDAIRTALETDPAKRSAQQRSALAKFHRENTDNPASRADTALADARKKLDELKASLPTVMVMKELPAPREAFLLNRGEYDKIGPKVERGLPAFLPPLPPGAPMNRLGLARWLVSAENPLTARVWVNRAWEKFFGLGLVRTTENLGSQAEWPTNPELLDWLATEFVRLKWDMKAMQKTIVMSATYRQSSKVTPKLLERDPENRLPARGPRFRLPAELIRDQALAVSGLLAEKLGGPSVRPYMPAGVWDETSVYGDLRNYKADAGDSLYRRSLYTIWKRTASPPSMTMFDSPTREICTVKRSTTNTPLQALALLNEVTYIEAARVLAQRMIAQGGVTPEQRIAWAFKRVTCREPRTEETAILAAGLAKRLGRFEEAAERAKQLVAVGAAQPDTQMEAGELAAYTLTANVLLNLDEVVTRE
jgi:mono/diheme cytochrome c family protein